MRLKFNSKGHTLYPYRYNYSFHLFLFFFFSLAWVPMAIQAATATREVPALTGPVVDEAQILSASEKQNLSELLANYEQQYQVQMQVLIINSLEGLPIEDFSIKVTDQWKLGTAKEDKGLLILLALQERKSRIEVGQGLEGDVTDLMSKRILNQARVFLREQNYYHALLFISNEVAKLTGHPLLDPSKEPKEIQVDDDYDRKKGILKTLSLLPWPLILFILFFLFNLVSSAFYHPSAWSSRTRRGYRGGSGGYGGWNDWGGGGGSGGGWSGGGGGFSGGGSSSDW